MTVRATAAALALALLLAGCSDSAGGSGEPPAPTSSTTADAPEAPGPEWQRATAGEGGFSPRRLRTVVREARARGSSCFVVARGGKLVVEEYWRGGSPRVAKSAFSVTKSVTSTLVGMAQDDGDLDVDRSAARFVPQWRGTPAADVTIRNLLSNDSGREWSPDSDYAGLLRAPDQTTYAVELAQTEPPGEVWAYNNAAIQTLDRVLREATGSTPADLARERLFEPLGMTNSRMSTDSSGSSTGTFSGLQSTCLDLARFGMLFAQDGKWEGEQLVSRAWVRDAVGASSQRLNAGYGLLWWVNRFGPLRGPLDQSDPTVAPGVIRVGRMVPDGPADLFAALGFGGQVVAVDPGTDTVVVRMGDPIPGEAQTTYTFADAARVVTYASR